MDTSGVITQLCLFRGKLLPLYAVHVGDKEISSYSIWEHLHKTSPFNSQENKVSSLER